MYNYAINQWKTCLENHERTLYFSKTLLYYEKIVFLNVNNDVKRYKYD